MYNQKQTNTEPFNAQWLHYTPSGVKKIYFLPRQCICALYKDLKQVLFPCIPLTDWSL